MKSPVCTCLCVCVCVCVFSVTKKCFFIPAHLTTKDLQTLLTVLHGATTQWELIGLALGFDPEDLKIIEQMPTLIPKGPVAYLKEMLHQWLKWCPPNHDRPTISSLCKALRSPTVGNECLANTLKDEIKALRGITVIYTITII